MNWDVKSIAKIFRAMISIVFVPVY